MIEECTLANSSHKQDWSKKYAGAKEILAYLKEVVDKYEIRQNIKFNTEVGYESTQHHITSYTSYNII